jgi:hypothetical protein
MKKIICAALVLMSLYAKAGSCSANGNGDWETPGNWSCGHVPGAGDDAMIAAGIIVTVQTNNLPNIGNLSIFGTLQFTNGSKLNLAATSSVDVYAGGSIIGGNGGAKLVFPSVSYAGPFSTTGPFYFSNSGSGGGVLPLTLVSFYSTQQNQEVILYWKTENEENINSFEIESSRSGSSDWQTLGIILSMAINGTGYSYSYVDHTKINGDMYYRLKMVDKDNKYVYSKVLLVTMGQSGQLSVTPTTVNSSMNVILPNSGHAQVSIFNTSGQQVKRMTAESDVFNIDVSSLNAGVYFIKVSQGMNQYATKFFKQ